MKEVLINALLKINPNSARRYFPDDKSFYIAALKNNSRYEIPEEEINKLFSDINTVKEIIRIRPEYLKYYTGSELEIYIEALKSNPSFELDRDIIEQKFSFRPDAMGELIKIRPNLIKYYQFADENTYIEAIKKGYNITEEDLESAFTFNPLGLIEVLKILPNNEIIEEFIKKNFKDRPEIIIELLKINPKYIYYYSATDDIKQNENIFKEAINNGYNPKPEDLKIYPQISQIDCVMELLIKQDPYLILQYMGEDTQKMAKLTNFSPKIPWEIVRYFKGDKKELIDNYELISSFLEKINIKEEKFIQYAFGSNNNWLEDIKKITTNNIQEFIQVKNYFFTNFFDNKERNNAQGINDFLNILKNYNRYKKLCVTLTKDNKELSEEDKEKIRFLFNQKETITNIKELSDFVNLSTKVKDKYTKMMKNCKDIDSKKDLICKMLFNISLNEAKERLSTYGDTMELKKLAFNDKKSSEVSLLTKDMMILTTMMEDIINAKDEEVLQKMIERIIEKYDLLFECSSFFINYEEKMKLLYEKEAQEMLTKVDIIKKSELLIDKEKTKKYGVEVLDFSDKEYIMLAHVKSNAETDEELINGVSTGKTNFICLSAISYRNQVYYSSGIIYGYDKIPDNSFIMSSKRNMGSNGTLNNNSSEVKNISREQRGILETSSSLEGNSEYLMFREGLEPKYIILPGGREPTSEEITVAKNYGLQFAITQEIGKSIENPKPFEPIEEQTSTKEIEEQQPEQTKTREETEKLKQLKEQLLEMIPKKQARKIAIITDPHGFYEPTLAALEDARKQGITEIYSLGDNIGTGPNPKEVMELLEEYDVKSIIGNHEIYAIEGIESLIEHLKATGAVREAERNGSWTNEQLTEEQKEKIKLYPKVIELIVGNKKIALCHSTEDLNSRRLIVNSEDFDLVLQGHLHFKQERGKTKTLSGVGIGSAGAGKAIYTIITEKPDGGYEIEEKEVKYDLENVRQDINISTLSEEDKMKANLFAQTGGRGR